MDNGKFFHGDSVATKRHSHVGKVFKKEACFSEGDVWFKEQRPPLPESTKSEIWYNILCEGGGSVCVPESDMVLLNEEVDMSGNSWADLHFRK